MPLISRKHYRKARRFVGGLALRAIGPAALRALAWTWRVEIRGEPPGEESKRNEGRLIALWHGRMLCGVHAHRATRFHVLVSPSDDGSLTTLLLRAFGFRIVRGSTSRRGARALREMLELLQSGGVVVITPDGPRGPRHGVNPGLAWMARATGYPIQPIAFAADRAWHLSSWDNFTIPKPRARVVIDWGELMHVPREATPAELERVSQELRSRLMSAEARAFAQLGCEVDW